MPQQMGMIIRVMLGVALLLGATLPGLGDAQASLVSAVLPGSRSVQVGTTATAFGLLINGGTTTATSCSIAPGTSIPATFSYQTTDPTTNALTGSPNTPVDLAAGQSQTFIVSLTPTAEIPPTDVALSFDCTNTDPAPSTVGLNTLLLSASPTPIPDIVALVATPTNDGVTHLPGATGGIGSTGVFVVASLNVGATGTMTVSADTGNVSLPLAITICQTNTGTGACLAPPGSSVTTDILANTTPSFGVFVEGLGPIPFDPATNRIFIRFKDAGGITRGSTSVAVQTDGPAPLIITSATSLPPGAVNQPYNATLTASGGTAPFSWSVIAGALPGGLTLDSSTGQISGTPTTAGTFTGTFQLQDSSIIQQSAQQLFSLAITPSQPGGGGGGTLTISGAPAVVGGTFVPNAGVSTTKNDPIGIVTAAEANQTHDEGMTIAFEYATGELATVGVIFVIGELTGGTGWSCSGSFIGPGLPMLPGTCTGVMVNRSGGTVTFSNTVLEDLGTGAPPITINGTLTFTPF